MKTTFNEFLADNKNCSRFKENVDAIKIFNFLNSDENIIKMIEYADQGKPALAGCVLELEQKYDSMEHFSLDFTDAFTRTVVGRMVKSILKPFGYIVVKQKDFPKEKKGKYFTSAACYKFDEATSPSMRIIKIIKTVEK